MKTSVGLISNQPPPAATAGRRKTTSELSPLNKTCQDFEAVFLHELFKGMRTTGIESGLLEKGPEQDIIQDMLDTEVANAAAAQNTLGIAKSLLKQFGDKKG